jgi:hypothetical protein
MPKRKKEVIKPVKSKTRDELNKQLQELTHEAKRLETRIERLKERVMTVVRIM